jgi:hypothetical protein
VNLERIEIPDDAEEIRDIDVGPDLLQAAFGLEGKDGSRLTQALAKIQMVQVRSFSLDRKSTGKIRSQLEELEERLDADDWRRLVRIKDRDEYVTVRVKRAEEGIAGLLVIAFAPEDEVTVANLVGELDLALLADLMTGMGGVDFEEVMEELDDY